MKLGFGMAATATRRAWFAHCSRIALAGASAVAIAPAPATAQTPAQAAATAAPSRGAVVLVVGDSLSAEYGLARGTGWVALLEQQIARDRISARVVNASISGDTTSGGRSRLAALLTQHRPTHVVIELGGNDALRGLPLAMTQDNLTAMVRAVRAAGARAVLVGMQVPPNYGRQYGESFFGLFAKVAQAEGATLVPFLLKGVADVPDSEALFQADRIHPAEAAHPRMLANVWPVLRPLLVSGR